MKTGIELIAEERQRQISKEGWTTEHDDEHDHRELARAAESYVSHYVSRQHVIKNEYRLPGIVDGPKAYITEPPPESWPWDDADWKPKNPIADLIKAGALIAAEIDRLQRLERKKQ